MDCQVMQDKNPFCPAIPLSYEIDYETDAIYLLREKNSLASP